MSRRQLFNVTHEIGRRTGEDFGCCRLNPQRHLLDGDVVLVRRRAGAGTGAVLDPHAGTVAMATLS